MSRPVPICLAGRRTRLAATWVFLLRLGLSGAAEAQDLQCEKYRYDNGLTVILREDHRLPVVAVHTLFRVGSRDEREGRSGFAHLFEHLMFMGTQRVPGGQFDLLMEAGGGSNNASTGSDTTSYYSTGPAALLPLLLWLDADRLEDLGRTMDQEKLDRQREVVRNERRQSYENQPYGRAQLLIQELLFPPGHPYHHPVIGSHVDLEAATVGDVQDFFATYYVPRNASLCIVGDFDTAGVRPLIDGLYGTLPGGAPVPRPPVAPAKLEGVQRATVLDNVQLPMILIAYHSPARFAPGEVELDLLADLLAEGKTSRLYRRLVDEEQSAVEVSAEQEAMQLGSMFHIRVQARANADLDRVEAALDEEVERLRVEGPAEDELERCKSVVELDMLSGIAGAVATADRLNEYEYYLGEPNSFRRDLDRYRSASPEGVRAWAQKVLTPQARVIVRVLPVEPERKPSPRDQRPAEGSTATFIPPAPDTFSLGAGIPVLLWRKTDLPLVAVELILRPTAPLDEPHQAGLASLTAEMLGEGAGSRDARQFGDAVRMLGATFSATAEHEYLRVSIMVLKRNLDPAVRLLADAVQQPRFDASEWERVKRLRVEKLEQDEEEPDTVADRVAARLLFGEKHPYGWPVEGTPTTVAALGIEDVRHAHERLVRSAAPILLVAGDVTADDARTVLEGTFGDWKLEPTSPSVAREFAPPAHEGPRVAVVDRPGAVQTVICWIMPGPPYTDARRLSYRLLGSVLGGSFTSRLIQNLREAHGYTYGVDSGFVMGPAAGYFFASSSVQTEVTGAAVAELLRELRGARGGDITPAEINKTRALWRMHMIQSFEGLSSLLSAAEEPLTAGLPIETLSQDGRALANIDADALNQLAGVALPLDHGVLVLVGDQLAIQEQLRSLDLPPPEKVKTGSGRP